MKKILYVATVVKLHIMEFHIPYLKMLKEKGWETAVAAKNDYENKEDCEIPYCDRFYDVNFERTPFSMNNITAYKQLKKIIDEGEYDIIHCHTPMGGVLARLAGRTARAKGTKIIYTAHGFHFFDGAPKINWILYYPIEKLLSYITDVIVTINEEDYRRAKKDFKAKYVEKIPGIGVDLTAFSKFNKLDSIKVKKRYELGIPLDSYVLLSVGELGKRKNQIVVIRALGTIKNKSVYYLIAGVGALESYYRTEINRLLLNENIRLLGYRNDISELCQVADVFVHPSIREGLGIAPLEAMASGLPLITTYINGMKDYTSNQVTGVCIKDPNSIEEMANGIDSMLKDGAFRERCGKNNLKIVKKFSLENSIKIMSMIYKKAMNIY